MENKDFYKWQDKLRSELSSSEYMVYTFIYDKRDNKTEVMTYKQSTIAKYLGLGTATVSRVIKSLKEKGYITVGKLNKVIGNLNKYICNICWSFTNKSNEDETIENLDNIDMEIIDEVKEKKDFSKKIIQDTKIEKITDKQNAIINTFTNKTILETITIAKKKKCRFASFFIDLLVDRAIANNTITDIQIKILNIAIPEAPAAALEEPIIIADDIVEEEFIGIW